MKNNSHREIKVVSVVDIYDVISENWRRKLDKNIHTLGWEANYVTYNQIHSTRTIILNNNIYGVNFPVEFFKTIRPTDKETIKLTLKDPSDIYDLFRFPYIRDQGGEYSTWALMTDYNWALKNPEKTIIIENNFFGIPFNLDHFEVSSESHIDFLEIARLTH